MAYMRDEQKKPLAAFVRERLTTYRKGTKKESGHEEDKNVSTHLHGHLESQKRLVTHTCERNLREKCYIYDPNCAGDQKTRKGRRPEDEKW